MDGETPEPVEKQRKNSGGATGKGFKPGQSGNPKGRPRNEFSLTAMLRDAMAKKEIAGATIPEGLTVAQAVVNVAIKAALEGDFRYAKEIWDRLDGKVKDAETEIPEGEIRVTIRNGRKAEPPKAPDA